jgi:hypothetical protein
MNDFLELMADLPQYKFISLLSQPISSESWGHRYYVELGADNAAVWKAFVAKHRGLKLLGSFDGKR